MTHSPTALKPWYRIVRIQLRSAAARLASCRTARLAGTTICALLLGACLRAPTSAPPVPGLWDGANAPQARPMVPASSACFRYEGRFDFADTNAPVVIWQASRIHLDFDGDSVQLLFEGAKGQNFFNAQVDGLNSIVEIDEGSLCTNVVLSAPGTGRHHLTLFKRSEAIAGTVRFRGVELSPGAKAWAPRLPAYQLRMQFIGDSITVGACNEDGDKDQWDSRRTHNAALSYAALTAEALGADHRNTAVSGMGIATGWVKPKAGEVWDRMYPDPSSPRADLRAWTPQVVLVNLGENDYGYPYWNGQSFPTNFTTGYVALVGDIRRAWPGAHLVLLRGGMHGGAQSEELRAAWESAVAQLETRDKALSHFVFKHWSRNHPRVADAWIMADELIAWLKTQEFMSPRLRPVQDETNHHCIPASGAFERAKPPTRARENTCQIQAPRSFPSLPARACSFSPARRSPT